jgi:sugar phosphate isomerase/epimerase
MGLKYAFMSFSCPQSSLVEMLEMAKQYGYDGIEPRVSADHAHGIEPACSAEVRAQVRRHVAESGVTLCCIATSCHYADPSQTMQQLELTRRCIDLAADLGIPGLRVFGGQLSAQLSRADAIMLLTESFGQVAPYASERNVTLYMETHDDWCTPQHVADVMAHVNHPAIAVNWDIMHPVRQGNSTMDQSFQILRPWIRHVHFHDGMLRLDETVLMRVGKGEIDHRRAVELLQQDQYTGYLSGEWIGWEPPEVHLPREIVTMKSYEA